MAFDPVHFRNTKHIMRAANFLRDLVARGHINMQHVKGVLMIADFLTKAVARPHFIELMRMFVEYALHAHA